LFVGELAPHNHRVRVHANSRTESQALGDAPTFLRSRAQDGGAEGARAQLRKPLPGPTPVPRREGQRSRIDLKCFELRCVLDNYSVEVIGQSSKGHRLESIRGVIRQLLTRSSRIEEDLIDQLFNSSEKRLARLLLLLANFGKEGRLEPIVGNFSQETLAEMIGTTRSRVSFFMNKFRKLGFIDYNRRLEVHNSLLNLVLHDTPEIK
jgi:hypothetical protein